uniref:Uncharacterized protein n=1 Tax=Triticum urartu TaxID=4572 RepID=A0A8R7P9L2_TRIUA
ISVCPCVVATNTCLALLVNAAEALDDGDQSPHAQVTVAVRHHRREHLPEQRRPGQRGGLVLLLLAIPDLQCHAKVLDDVARGAGARREVAAHRARAEDVHDARPRRALGHRVEEQPRVEPGGVREGQGLAEADHRPDHRPGHRHLVGDLAALPAAGRAHVGRRAEVREERGEPGHHGLVAPGEDGQRAVAGTGVATGDGGIDSVTAGGARGRGDLPREGRGGARAVHEDAAGAETRQGAGRAVQHHRADVSGVAHHGEHHVGGRSHGSGRVSDTRACGDQGIRLDRRASVRSHREPSSEEARGHGAAHDANADPSHPRSPPPHLRRVTKPQRFYLLPHLHDH